MNLTTALQSITHPGLFADVIRESVEKEPAKAIEMIKDQLRGGHRVLVVEIIGENLVCLIENLEV